MRIGTIKEEVIQCLSKRNMNVLSIEQRPTQKDRDLCFDTAPMILKIALSNRLAVKIELTYHARLISVNFYTLDKYKHLIAMAPNHLDKVGMIVNDLRIIHERVTGPGILKREMKIYG